VEVKVFDFPKGGDIEPIVDPSAQDWFFVDCFFLPFFPSHCPDGCRAVIGWIG
jgi:hypothetical protein